MKPASPMVYESRPVQVARYLKEQIRAGQWKQRLPSERTLAAQLDVGRNTVRAALGLLQKEGMVLRRGREGTSLRGRAGSGLPYNMSVGVLLLMRVEQTTYRTLHWLDEFRRILYRQNIHMEIYDGYVRKPRLLPGLLSHARHDAWVLVYPTLQALRWCLENNLRGVVVGTLDEGIPLPSVDIHYRALCRHAAGRMLHLGHRHLTLLLHQREWGADAKSVQGFLEGAGNLRYSGVTTTVEYHDGTPAGIRRLTDRLLARKPMPTAWIVAVTPHFLTVTTHLLGRRIAIPGQISLISQDAEPWQHFASPEPTRYEADVAMLARQTARHTLRAISGKAPVLHPIRVMPRLLPGATLAPAQPPEAPLR